MSDWFDNAHPESGPWYSLKGGTLAPHIQMPMESQNQGDPRFNGKVAPPQGWTASLHPVDTPTGPAPTNLK